MYSYDLPVWLGSNLLVLCSDILCIHTVCIKNV